MYILDEEEMEKIQNLLNHFLQHNEVISTKKNGYQMTYYMHPQVREALT
jgi:hypothetical protein